jgi:hypothetical protein
MSRILLLAILFLLVGIAIGLLISNRRRTAAPPPPVQPPPQSPAPHPDPTRERLVRRLIGGLLLLTAALIALGYAYYGH